jgi:hypothetical protein
MKYGKHGMKNAHKMPKNDPNELNYGFYDFFTIFG